MIRWVFGAFFIVHLYTGILAEIEERNGALGSIFGGCKFDKEGAEEPPPAGLDLGMREAAVVKQGRLHHLRITQNNAF